MSGSKVRGQYHQGQETRLALPSLPGSVRMVCARCKQRESAADSTIPSLPGRGWFRGLACGACLV